MVYMVQGSFSRGEVAPELHNAQHLQAYSSGVAEALNAVVLKRGGIRRRGGTKFIGEVKFSDRKTILIPFSFSTEQTYMLEVGHLYFRVYQSGGRVGSVEIVTPYAESDIGNLVFTQQRDTIFLTDGTHKPRKILRMSDIDWETNSLKFTDGPYLEQNATGTTLTPSGTGHATPKMTSDVAVEGVANDDVSASAGNAYNLFDLNLNTALKGTKLNGGWVSFTFTAGGVPSFNKVVDGYYIVSGGRALRSPISWRVEGYDGADWVPLDTQSSVTDWQGRDTKFFNFTNSTAYEAYRFFYYDIGSDDTQFQLAEIGFHESAAFQTPINLTASDVMGINDGQGFLATDVGRAVEFIAEDGLARSLEIVTVVSATVVTVIIHDQALPSLSPSTRWKLGAWSDETGWPKLNGFFKERLSFAATEEEPTTVWMSVSQDFINFKQSLPLLATDALSLEILSKEVNDIQWLVEDEELICGTSKTVRRIGKTSSNAAFGPTNVEQKRATSVGANRVQPFSIGTTVLYLGRFGQKLLELVYSFDVNGYVSQDVSAFSNHLFDAGVIGGAYQEYPDSTLWMYDSAGKGISFTYVREQEIFGFCQHDFGGKVESQASISTATEDELWMIVNRVIDGQTVRYIEVLQYPFNGADKAQEDAWHLDCAAQYNGALANEISGLDHLEGETVGLHADGAYLGTAVVTGGVVNLPNDQTASKILVGLPFTTRVKLLKPPRQIQEGSALGLSMKPDNVYVSVFETGTLLIGSDTSGPDGDKLLDEIIFHEDGDLAGPVPLKTNTYKTSPPIRWEDDGQLVVEAQNTQPMTLVSINLNLDGEP